MTRDEFNAGVRRLVDSYVGRVLAELRDVGADRIERDFDSPPVRARLDRSRRAARPPRTLRRRGSVELGPVVSACSEAEGVQARVSKPRANEQATFSPRQRHGAQGDPATLRTTPPEPAALGAGHETPEPRRLSRAARLPPPELEFELDDVDQAVVDRDVKPAKRSARVAGCGSCRACIGRTGEPCRRARPAEATVERAEPARAPRDDRDPKQHPAYEPGPANPPQVEPVAPDIVSTWNLLRPDGGGLEAYDGKFRKLQDEEG